MKEKHAQSLRSAFSYFGGTDLFEKEAFDYWLNAGVGADIGIITGLLQARLREEERRRRLVSFIQHVYGGPLPAWNESSSDEDAPLVDITLPLDDPLIANRWDDSLVPKPSFLRSVLLPALLGAGLGFGGAYLYDRFAGKRPQSASSASYSVS